VAIYFLKARVFYIEFMLKLTVLCINVCLFVVMYRYLRYMHKKNPSSHKCCILAM